MTKWYWLGAIVLIVVIPAVFVGLFGFVHPHADRWEIEFWFGDVNIPRPWFARDKPVE